MIDGFDKKKRIVLKIGGALLANDITNLVKDIKILLEEYDFIIIHGGGPQINEIYQSMNKKPKIYKTPKGFSTRYTDPEAIEVIKMALGGSVNKTLVELFQREGINAFGFLGADGKNIIAERKDKIMVMMDDGRRMILRNEYSGKNPVANPKLINFLIENHYLPVIGSTCISQNGELLNVDGDRVANAVAVALNVDFLISLTDVEGIYKDMESKEIIKKVKISEADNLLKSLNGGMKKKLYSALESLKSGLNEVIITSGITPNPLISVLKEEYGTRICVE